MARALCLEACPTGAIVEAGVLDATRCLSYLTIELGGGIPDPVRPDIASHVYGCDICQDVCPWNAVAATSDDECWLPHPVLDRPKLTELWRQPDEVLGPVVEGSAMSHAGVRRVRRNVAVALGNSASSEAAAVLAEPTVDDSKDDPLVLDHVEWARARSSRQGHGKVGDGPPETSTP